ncbi:YkvA family protein [Herminiimonas sp. CN]|uniref:YkvA family protein n=1 Tax=Herminiimonas sp. CN TaxID=1349818 RepID=UPI000473059E|nr:YkvA family protein [Herminiimonas sp. CN]
MLSRIRFLLNAGGRDAALLWYALRQPETPATIKIGAILLALYVISPLDVIPDLIPVLGWLDDATLLAFGIPLLLRKVPADIRQAAENSCKYRPGKAK